MQGDTQRGCSEGAVQGGTGQVIAQQLQFGLHCGASELLRMHPHRGLGDAATAPAIRLPAQWPAGRKTAQEQPGEGSCQGSSDEAVGRRSPRRRLGGRPTRHPPDCPPAQAPATALPPPGPARPPQLQVHLPMTGSYRKEGRPL